MTAFTLTWRRARRPALAVLSTFALVAGLNLVVGDGDQPEPARSTLVAALALAPQDVRQLTVSSDEGRVDVRQEAGGIWVPASPGTENAAVLMTELEDRLFPLQAYRDFGGDPRSAAYGLDDPEMTMRVQDVRRRWRSFDIGAVTFTGAGSYASAPGGERRIFLVARAAVDALRSLIRGEKYETPRTPEEVEAEQEQIDSVKAMQERQPGAPLPPIETHWLRQGLAHEGPPPAATEP